MLLPKIPLPKKLSEKIARFSTQKIDPVTGVTTINWCPGLKKTKIRDTKVYVSLRRWQDQFFELKIERYFRRG